MDNVQGRVRVKREKGTNITAENIRGQVNDTRVSLTGQIANPVEPKIKLLVTSPDLNLDRLLPPARAEKPGEKPSQEEGSRAPEKTVKAEWPPMALKTTAQVQVEADAGRYQGITFQNLKKDCLTRQ